LNPLSVDIASTRQVRVVLDDQQNASSGRRLASVVGDPFTRNSAAAATTGVATWQFFGRHRTLLPMDQQGLSKLQCERAPRPGLLRN